MSTAIPPAHKPAPTIELVWSGELTFQASSSGQTFVIDGNTSAGPSPVQLLAAGLASCMAADVVDIVKKGRHPLSGLRATLTGTRAAASPRRLLTLTLHFVIDGDVPAAAVERAIALSRDRYCSVWHSMRQDISLDVTFALVP